MRGISIVGCGYICNGSSDETDQVGWRYCQLQASHSGADIYRFEIICRIVKKCRETLLHTYRGTSSADISRHSEQILHRYHLHFLVAGCLGQSLEVHFRVAGYDADYMSGLVSVQYQGLEYAVDILSQTICNVLRGQIILVELVRNEFICNARLVQQPGRVRLFYLLCHNGCKDTELSDVLDMDGIISHSEICQGEVKRMDRLIVHIVEEGSQKFAASGGALEFAVLVQSNEMEINIFYP